jgi:hypothetical protein
MLVGRVSVAGDQIGCVSCLRTRLLCLPPRVAFFSRIRDAHCYCSSMSSPSDTTRSLSTEGHSYSDNNSLSLSLSPSLSLLRRSIARSVCSDVPAGLSHSPLLAARALRIALNFSPQKTSAAAGRLAACATEKGASGRRPRHPSLCGCDRDAASNHPPRGRARLVESHRQGGN